MQAKLDAADYTDLTKQQLVGDLLTGAPCFEVGYSPRPES